MSLTAERHRLEQDWASYTTGTQDALALRQGITREISQSWRRSQESVSPARRTAPIDDPQETLSE